MATIVSRHKKEDEIIYDNEKMYGIRKRVSSVKNIDDSMYPVKNGDTLKSIAYDIYDDARLYWVIAEFNKIIDPFKKLIVGTELMYPSMKRVKRDYI